jgi:hypothetical protein
MKTESTLSGVIARSVSDVAIRIRARTVMEIAASLTLLAMTAPGPTNASLVQNEKIDIQPLDRAPGTS